MPVLYSMRTLYRNANDSLPKLLRSPPGRKAVSLIIHPALQTEAVCAARSFDGRVMSASLSSACLNFRTSRVDKRNDGTAHRPQESRQTVPGWFTTAERCRAGPLHSPQNSPAWSATGWPQTNKTAARQIGSSANCRHYRRGAAPDTNEELRRDSGGSRACDSASSLLPSAQASPVGPF